MDRQSIRQALLRILEETRGEPCGEVDESTNLREGLGLDSVDLVCMVMEIQHQLKVNLSITELEPLICLGDLLNLLEAKLGDSRAAA
jgi:acyl carrier protein